MSVIVCPFCGLEHGRDYATLMTIGGRPQRIVDTFEVYSHTTQGIPFLVVREKGDEQELEVEEGWMAQRAKQPGQRKRKLF